MTYCIMDTPSTVLRNNVALHSIAQNMPWQFVWANFHVRKNKHLLYSKLSSLPIFALRFYQKLRSCYSLTSHSWFRKSVVYTRYNVRRSNVSIVGFRWLNDFRRFVRRFVLKGKLLIASNSECYAQSTVSPLHFLHSASKRLGQSLRHFGVAATGEGWPGSTTSLQRQGVYHFR